MADLMKMEAGVVATSVPDTPANTMESFIAMALTNKDVDADKLQKLLDMRRQYLSDEARVAFHRAMAEAQAEMQPVVRDAENTQTRSRYARLETIDAAIRPVYSRHGFRLSYDTEAAGDRTRVICIVSHIAGHSERYQLESRLDTVGAQGKVNKTELHGLGSTVSYLRRYLACMIFNVVLRNEDTDGAYQPRYINGEQCREIENLLIDTRSDKAKFLAFFKVQDVTEIIEEMLPRALNMLRAKQRAAATSKPELAT